MRIRALGAALLLAGCASGAAGGGGGGGTCGLGRVAAIPFVYRSGHMIVDGTINDTKVALVFDTGAGRSVLTPSVVRRADIREEPRVEGFSVTSSGIGGARVDGIVTADSVTLGSLRARDFHFFEADVLARNTGLDGLLSTDILDLWDIDLDTAGHKIELFKPMGDCAHPTVRMSGDVSVVPFAERPGDNGFLYLDVTIGGRTVRALLDTGAPHTTLFHEAIGKLGLDPTKLPAVSGVHVGAIGGIGPETVAASARVLLPLQIGDLEIDNLPVVIADGDSPGQFDMLLGLDFLRMIHTWISYSSGTLVMQPYQASPSEAVNAPSKPPRP